MVLSQTKSKCNFLLLDIRHILFLIEGSKLMKYFKEIRPVKKRNLVAEVKFFRLPRQRQRLEKPKNNWKP